MRIAPDPENRGRQTRERKALGEVAHHSPEVEALLSVWREIQTATMRALEKLTLAELLRRSRQGDSLTYQI